MTPSALLDLVLRTHVHGFLLALGATLLLTPLVIRLAKHLGWVDRPRADRWHEETTALMGGIAIFGGATIGVLSSAPLGEIGLLWGGAVLLFVVGFVDDRAHVSPPAKLTAQVVATGLLLSAGYAFGQGWSPWLSVPLTFLWVVGITNAINLLDNMDGLAAGVAGIAALVLGLFAFWTGSETGTALGASVAGAAAGFLAFNFKPARIFMGDCGSLFLGYVIAALGLGVQQHAPAGGPVAAALVPLAVLAVPIFDTTLVTVVRKLSGRAVSQGGRDHTSHRLVFLGLSEPHAVLVLYGISLLSGSVALFVLFADVMVFYALSVFVAVAIGILGVHLARAQVYGSETATRTADAPPTPLQRPLHLLHTLVGHRWKAVVGVLGDAMLVGAAFVVAHVLRYEQGLPPGTEAQMEAALPLVIAAKVTVFYLAGLYRGIWRHAGTPEMVRAVAATVLAAIPTFGVLAAIGGVGSVSTSVLVIDAMVTTLAVLGARFGFRGLRQYIAAKNRDGRRTLLYGAGDTGILALRELRKNAAYNLHPVAFVDDDPLKQGQAVQGLPVLGGTDDLPRLCDRHDIDEVIITSRRVTEDQRHAIREARDEVDCHVFSFAFEPVRPRTAAPELPPTLGGDGQS